MVFQVAKIIELLFASDSSLSISRRSSCAKQLLENKTRIMEKNILIINLDECVYFDGGAKVIFIVTSTTSAILKTTILGISISYSSR